MAVTLLHWVSERSSPSESTLSFLRRCGGSLDPMRSARLVWAVERVPSEAAWNYLGWTLVQDLASYTQEERVYLLNEAGVSAVDILLWETATVPPAD